MQVVYISWGKDTPICPAAGPVFGLFTDFLTLLKSSGYFGGILHLLYICNGKRSQKGTRSFPSSIIRDERRRANIGT